MKLKQTTSNKTMIANDLIKIAKELLAAKPIDNMDKELQKIGKALRAEDIDKAIDALSDAGKKLNTIKKEINSTYQETKGINQSHLKQAIAALKPVLEGKVEGEKAQKRLEVVSERLDAAFDGVETVASMLKDL